MVGFLNSFNLGSLTSPQSIVSLISMFLWSFAGIIFLTILGILIYHKVKYKYRAVIYRRRQTAEGNPGITTKIEGKAGFFNKKGKDIFKIKYGLFPWQIIKLSKLPNPRYMDMNNTVYYQQYGKDAFVQSKLEIDWENASLHIEPIESDVKFAALIDFKERNMSISPDSTNKTIAVATGAMAFVLVAGIIVLWFISKGS